MGQLCRARRQHERRYLQNPKDQSKVSATELLPVVSLQSNNKQNMKGSKSPGRKALDLPRKPLLAQAERQHNPDRNCHVHKAIDQPDNYLRRAVSVASVVQYLHRQLHKVHPYPSVLLSPLRHHLKSEVDRSARPRVSPTTRRTHLPNLRPMDPASKPSHHYIYPSEKSPTQH